MKKHYEIMLIETGGDIVDVKQCRTKTQALKICKYFTKQVSFLDLLHDRVHIDVQLICDDKDSIDYSCWIDILEYDFQSNTLR